MLFQHCSYVTRRALTLSAISLLLIGAYSNAFAQKEKVFRWSSAGDFLTFDVHAQNESLNSAANAAVYEALVRYNTDMRVEPCLASQYQRVKNGFLFTIRENVRFHEGETLTAEDVAYSINRALLPESQFKAAASGILGAEVVNSRQVLVKTVSGSPVFLNQLTQLCILNKKWAEKHNAFRPQNYVSGEESYLARHANGTGPFKLVSREVDVKTQFVANHEWWDEKNRRGNIEKVIYTPINSAATRTAALLSGQVDFVLDPAPQDIARLERNDSIRVLSRAEDRVMMIALDQYRDQTPYANDLDGKPLSANPFKDVRVRQALSLAVNRQALVKSIMRGKAVATNTVISDSVFGYDSQIAQTGQYDLPKAKALLKEAGFEKGFAFTLDTPNNRWVNDENLCKALASMWAKLNVKVNVHSMPRAQYFPKVLSFDTSAGLVGWGSSTFDAFYPLQSLSATYDGTSGAGISNIGRASDKQMDALLKKLNLAEDLKEREAIARQALSLEQKRVLHIPLLQPMFSWAMKKNIDPIVRPDNKLTLEWIVMH
jgi:probable periplasmic dipeptide transport protein